MVASKEVRSPDPGVSFKHTGCLPWHGCSIGSGSVSYQPCSGVILICEVVDAPVIMGALKPVPNSPRKEVIQMLSLFVGVDVSLNNNVVYIMKPDGEKYGSLHVANTKSGAAALVDRIISALNTLNLKKVVIGLEATSIYGDPFVMFLREDGKLASFDRAIHVLNPKLVNEFKKSYPDLPKNDDVDSFVIADKLRFNRGIPPAFEPDYRYTALQTLTRQRFCLVQNLTREKVRFGNYLFLKCSGLAQDKDFKNTSATTIALMEQFDTIDDLANADLNQLAAVVIKASNNHYVDPECIAKTIQAVAKGSYRLLRTVNDSINQAMSVSIANMRFLEKQVKTLDAVILKQFEIIPNTLISVPGIGKVYSAGIIAEIGNIRRFKSQASVAKYAGLVWNEHDSGNFEGEITRMIKSGNRYLRYYLLEAADSVRRYDSEYKAYYDCKFKEVNRFQHKRALALTARKLVRLIFRLMKDNRLYVTE